MPQPYLEDPGPLKAFLIGAGQKSDSILDGLTQMYLAARGETGPLNALAASVADKRRIYEPLRQARPVSTGFGEALPAMAVPMAGKGLLGMVGSGAVAGGLPEALSYGSPEDRAKRTVGGVAAGAIGGLLSPVVDAGVRKAGGLLSDAAEAVARNARAPSTMGPLRKQMGVVRGKWVDVYHGTDAAFEPTAYDLGRAGVASAHDSANAPVMWTSRSPKVAGMFAVNDAVDKTPIGRYGAAGQGTAAIGLRGVKEGGNIQPLRVKLDNPAVINGADAERMILGSGDFRESGGEFVKFVEAMKAAGHDGVVIKANPRGALEFRAEQYLPFSPSSQVISRFQ